MEIEIAAGRAIADIVQASELSSDYIVPTVFNPNVVSAAALAVEKVARASKHASSSAQEGRSLYADLLGSTRATFWDQWL